MGNLCSDDAPEPRSRLVAQKEAYQADPSRERLSDGNQLSVETSEETPQEPQPPVQQWACSKWCHPSKANAGDSGISDKSGLQCYKKLRLLGQGGFGSVYLVSSQLVTAKYHESAMKIIQKRHFSPQFLTQAMKLEKEIMSGQASFLVRLENHFEDQQHHYLIMQLAEKGDLFALYERFLEEGRTFTEQQVRFVIACVLLGLEELHSRNFSYGDLKLENILICSRGYIKLTDFGLSRRTVSKAHLERCQEIKGTLAYMAPEIVEDDVAGQPSDLWALGVLLYELLLLKPPYPDDETIQKGIFRKASKHDEQHRIWPRKGLSQRARHLINALLRVNPADRLGFSDIREIRQHPFFSGFDWHMLLARELESPLAVWL